MDRNLLEAELERDEGWVDHPYKDSLGFWTCGIGFLIDSRKGGCITPQVLAFWGRQPGGVAFPMPRVVAVYWLGLNVDEVERGLTANLPWFATLDDVRQRVLANMAYELGVDGLLTFTTFLGLVEKGDYAAAADDLLHTTWNGQVPERAARLEQAMRTGVMPA